MSSRSLRTSAALLVLLSPACVVRLSERNAPLVNGGVTGAPADCSTVQPPPVGAIGTVVKTKFVGRHDFSDPKDPAKPLVPVAPLFDWSGNYMNARFEGTEVTWGVQAGAEQVFEVIIDGNAQQVILPDYRDVTAPITTRTHKVSAGVHDITVMRSSEALFGITRWIPFTFVGTQLPPKEYARRIEVIGDSITCGYGNEGPNATCPYNVPIRQVTNAEGVVVDVSIPETQNIYLSYTSIAARKLGAEAVTLCFSGKGIAFNYREQGVGEGAILNPNDKPDIDARTLIPDYYKRTIATDHPTIFDPATPDPMDIDDRPGVPWPFNEPAAEQPQVVLINVGTNDFARDANQDSIADGIDLPTFKEKYKEFLQFVRGKRPNAEIFIAVPPMVTDLFPLDNARTNFRTTLRSLVTELGDTKLHAMELVEQGVRYGLGCDYHPNLEVHRIMADQVVGAVKSKTCWSTVEAK